MKKFIITSCLMVVVLLTSNGQENNESTKVPMSLAEEITFDQSTDLTVSALRKSLLQAFNQNTVISLSNKNNFLVIQPSLNILTKDITPTAPPMVAMNIDLMLSLINANDGSVFHSTSLPLKGVGTNDNKAYLNAFNTIRYRQKAIDDFIQIASKKVGQFYNQNCDRIISEAQTFKNLEQYDAALFKLKSIPSIAEGCYARAASEMEDTYKLSLNQDCQKYLNIAQTATALRRYEAAAQAIIQINPEAPCYKDAQALKDKITAETGDAYDKVWDYANKRLEIAGDVVESKYNALAEVYKNQSTGQPNTTGGSGSSSSSSSSTTVILNGERSNVPDGQKSNTVGTAVPNLPAQFKIVSPAIRAASGNIVVTEQNVTLYGIIDEPKNAKLLLIDGLETSWDEDGVFSRTISVEKEEKTLVVQLTDKQGRSNKQVLPIKKVDGAKTTSTASASTGKVLKKRALVIGNSNYQHLSQLKNPVNDAKDMAAVLKDIGFEVQVAMDASFDKMRTLVGDFTNNKNEYDVTVFFFAGHGLEIDGENFLMPVEIKADTPDKVKLNSLSVDVITKILEMKNDDKLNIVILDACRNNPFPSSSRSAAGGLARVTPASGMLIAYATSPGKTASDGSGENGLYTGELIKQMSIPQRIEDVFMNTRNEVERKSQGNQKPWEEARLRGVFYLKSE